MSPLQRCPACNAPFYGSVCPACEAGRERSTFVAPIQRGQIFREMEILEMIGRGGMGIVYKARHVRLDRLVALKILPPQVALQPATEDRFAREAKVLASLSHPNIVGIYDCGKEAGLFFFAMEFVDGFTLREPIVKRKITPEKAVRIAVSVLKALECAHAAGVVHRDIKPENILIDRKGHVKVADFGLAKLTGVAESLAVTQSGALLGTARYMAPEQMGSAERADARADLYSTGAVLYEMLTGDPPAGRFPPPSKIGSSPSALDAMVLKALEKDPADRYATAAEFRTALVSSLETPVRKKPVSKGWIAAVAGVLLLGIAGLVWRLTRPSSSPPPPIVRTDGPAPLFSLPSPSGPVRTLATGAELLAGATTAKIEVWDLAARKSVASFGTEASSLAFRHDGKFLASAGADGEARIWEIATRSEFRKIPAESHPITAVAFHPEGRFLAVASIRKIRLVDIESGAERSALEDQPAPVHTLLFDARGTILVSASGDGIHVWEPDTQKFLMGLPLPEGTVAAIALDSKGSVLAGGFTDGRIVLWSLPSGRELRSFRAHDRAVRASALRADGAQLASSGADGQVKFWEVSTGKETGTIPEAAGALAFTPNGASLITASDDGILRVRKGKP